MLVDLARSGDLRTMERRRATRIFAVLPGRYTLADYRNAQGRPRLFACRAVNISDRAIALAASVIGDRGQRVVAHIDPLGTIEGAITRILSRGFVMSIATDEEGRSKLVEKIEWIERHKNHDVADQRRHVRFAPANPHSRLMLADGATMACLIIDLSQTGAAVSADIRPEIGSVVAVGAIVGRVVRGFAGGFALKFIQPQDRDSVETMALAND